MANMQLGQRDRPWRARINFKNGESSATIAAGSCVVLKAADVSQVVTPATAGAAPTPALFAGIAAKAMAPNEFGDVIVSGYVPAMTVTRMTRAASSDGWASFPAIAIGDYFTIETVNGFAARSGAGAALAAGYQIVALETLASATTLASTVGGAATVYTSAVKAWLRALV